MSRFSKCFSHWILGLAFALVMCAGSVFAKTNVILVVVDGGGYGAYRVASQYRTGEDRGLPFMKGEDGWGEFGCTTYSLSGVVQHSQFEENAGPQKTSYSEDGSYDPATHWLEFKTHMKNPTDSAASSTALNSGVKTKNGRVNYDKNDQPLETLAEYVVKRGFAAGAITNVGASHATPAGVAAHNMKRGDGKDIWREMVKKDVLSVVIGASHPWYNSKAQRRDKIEIQKYGPSEHAWGKITTEELYYGWKFIEKREDFQKIASGEMAPPKKLMGLPQVSGTFQASRADENKRHETVPTMTECALAGLNVLNQNEKGFYVLIESGAVDGLAHGNNKSRRIFDEMNECFDMVEAICEWVEKNSSWEETTLILTADHETGALFGPDADKEETLFQTPIGKGKGVFPEMAFYTGGHTNAPVPFFVRGAGLPNLEKRVRCTDEKFGKMWGFDGRILDNTDFVPAAKELFDRQ